MVAAMLAVVTSFLAGCGDGGVMSRLMLKPDRIIIERRPDPIYDRIFFLTMSNSVRRANSVPS
jgi:hypothetical protein